MKTIKPRKTVDPMKVRRSPKRWYLDWNRFLARKRIKWEQAEAAAGLAFNWTTCACGVQCAIIPRDPSGRPYDSQLAGYGAKFYGAVAMRDYSFARRVLRKIDTRAGVIMRGIKRNLQREKKISLLSKKEQSK